MARRREQIDTVGLSELRQNLSRYLVSPPRERLEDVATRLPARTSPAGTADAYLEKTRAPRTG